jgi:hypothetical protein
MGYYVEGNGFGHCSIPVENLDAALTKFKAVMLDPEYFEANARGGSWGPGDRVEKWYSWTNTADLSSATEIGTVLDQFGFEYDIGDDGSIINIYYPHNKSGQEDLLLNCISEFFSEGSYIDWSGEDGSLWRTGLGDLIAVERMGRVVYE